MIGDEIFNSGFLAGDCSRKLAEWAEDVIGMSIAPEDFAITDKLQSLAVRRR